MSAEDTAKVAAVGAAAGGVAIKAGSKVKKILPFRFWDELTPKERRQLEQLVVCICSLARRC